MRQSFAAEVGQHPAALPLLDVLDLKQGQLPPLQGAADQQGQHYIVALALYRAAARHLEQRLRLFLGQPVPEAGSLLPKVWRVRELDRLLGIEDAAAARLADQLANRRQPDVDRRDSETPLQQCGPVLHQQRARKAAAAARRTAQTAHRGL